MDGLRCLDPKCRKRLPDGTRYCPYCGMPVLQTMLPFWRPRFYRQAGIVVALFSSCAGVYFVLVTSLTSIWNNYELAMATATVTPMPTLTATPRPTRTPFPVIKSTLAPTETPLPTPTNVIVRLVKLTPVAVMGQVADSFRLFTEPNYSSVAVAGFANGQRVQILGRDVQGQWLKAQVGNASGWIKADLVALELPWTVDKLGEVAP